MFGDLSWWRGWHLDDLSQPRQADASQPEMAVGTQHDPMLHDLCGCGAGTTMIVPSLSFLALLLFFLWWFFHIGFDKRWRRRFWFSNSSIRRRATRSSSC